MGYLASDLVTDVRAGAMVATTTAGGVSDADILGIADSEIATHLVPDLMRVREEWFVRSKDYTVTAGFSEYRLPSQAVAGRTRSVQLVISGQVQALRRLEPSQAVLYSPTAAQGMPWGYYVRGANIVLVPTPSTAVTLRIQYPHRPGRLTVTATDFDTLAVINPITGNCQTTSAHTFANGITVDFISVVAPFETKGSGVVSGSATPAFTVPVADLGGVPPVAGDYVSRAEKSPVVQLPPELYQVLVGRTVAKLLMGLGYQSEAAQQDQSSSDDEKTALALLAPRMEGEARKITGGRLFRRGTRIVY